LSWSGSYLYGAYWVKFHPGCSVLNLQFLTFGFLMYCTAFFTSIFFINGMSLLDVKDNSKCNRNVNTRQSKLRLWWHILAICKTKQLLSLEIPGSQPHISCFINILKISWSHLSALPCWSNYWSRKKYGLELSKLIT